LGLSEDRPAYGKCSKADDLNPCQGPNRRRERHGRNLSRKGRLPSPSGPDGCRSRATRFRYQNGVVIPTFVRAGVASSPAPLIFPGTRQPLARNGGREATDTAGDYRRTDFFADLDFAAGLDSDFFAGGFFAAVFLAEVFFAAVFLTVVFFEVFFKTPALAVSDLTALPTGTLLTCFAADFAAATASVGTAGLPCSTR
jgi:hypothetical protein